MRRDLGQASVELIAGLPAVILVALLLFQLGAVGYTQTVVDGAAEAGALALAGGRSPRAAVRAALPRWARPHATVTTGADRVEVTLRPPSPLSSVGNRLRVTSVAAIGRGSP